MNKKIVFLILLAVVVVGIVLMSSRSFVALGPAEEEKMEDLGDPLDTVTAFFNDWFNARTSTSTDPYALGLPTDARLAPDVQSYIQNADRNAPKDPVLCLTELPPRIGAKPVFKLDESAQYIVLARGVGGVTPDRTVVDVKAVDGAWQITKIECISGESAPEREFDFERTGNLLKHDAPPLDPNTWYVVYEENGEEGHIAPLFFSESSICVNAGGEESVCQPDTFVNAIEATVKGGMTETGVEVKRIEYAN